MREIKFQYIWKRDTGVAVAVYDLEEIENGLAKAPRSRDGSRMSDWECIARRQYTGLKDRNGVEIYDRDIVKYKGMPWVVIFCKLTLCPSLMLSPRFGMQVDSFWKIYQEDCKLGELIEVVGNAHQNPELLEK